jgi:hypothetical protein
MMKILILVSLLISQFALAGGEGTSADDGGQAVFCKNIGRNRDQFVKTLDLFEARALYGSGWGREHHFTGFLHGSWIREPAVNRILGHLKLKLMKRIGADHEILKYFEIARTFTPVISDEVAETNDIGQLQVQIPYNCKVVQLAVRRRFSNEILIHNDFAQALGNTDVAAILLHEALHGYFNDQGSNLVVRQAIGYIFASSEFQKRNIVAFNQLLKTKQPVSGFKRR